MEFQYRLRIVDTDIDRGPRFCGPRFRDSYKQFSPAAFHSFAPAISNTTSKTSFTARNWRHGHAEQLCREPPDLGLAPTALWRASPPRHLEDPSLMPQTFPPHPPSLFPPPLAPFAMLREGRPGLAWGRRPTGVEGRMPSKRHLSGTKNQPKEEAFGTDIPRTSGGHSRGYPGPNLQSGQSKSWKNKHFGTDIHDPKARTSTALRGFQKLRSGKLWAEFSFPNLEPDPHLGVFDCCCERTLGKCGRWRECSPSGSRTVFKERLCV